MTARVYVAPAGTAPLDTSGWREVGVTRTPVVFPEVDTTDDTLIGSFFTDRPQAERVTWHVDVGPGGATAIATLIGADPSALAPQPYVTLQWDAIAPAHLWPKPSRQVPKKARRRLLRIVRRRNRAWVAAGHPPQTWRVYVPRARAIGSDRMQALVDDTMRVAARYEVATWPDSGATMDPCRP